MQQYALAHEFTDAAAERGVIAALTLNPLLFWELSIPAHIFAVERSAWDTLCAAITAEAATPTLPADWLPATDPKTAAARLTDLYQRRVMADIQERLSRSLFDPTKPAAAIALQLEEEAARAQATVQYTDTERPTWGSDLSAGVLRDMQERHAARVATGKAFTGITTGLATLDTTLNGFQPGLIIYGGAPGGGKTTSALGFTIAAARGGDPVIYVTFENSPGNLTLKGMCSLGSLDNREFERGFGNLAALQQAAQQWDEFAHRIMFLEGRSDLTVDHIRARATQAMHRHNTHRALIVVDYLQLMAKSNQELRTLGTVRERIGVLSSSLRGLAMRLNVPVLALCSLNRTANYGEGSATPTLDAFKDSGDLEFDADVAMIIAADKQAIATPPAEGMAIHVVKQRNGATGKVKVIMRKDFSQIREPERRR